MRYCVEILRSHVGYDPAHRLKYDQNGNVLWAKTAVALYARFSGITVDINGNCYVTGYYSAGSITFDTITLPNSGFPDMFAAKLDGNGNTIWAKHAGGSHHDYGNGISADNSGNCYVTGKFNSNSLSFGTVVLANTSNGGYDDIFTVKYDNIGNVIWAKRCGGYAVGTPNEDGYDIVADNFGNCIVTGYFSSDSISFGNSYLLNHGLHDIFIVKYDTAGVVIWSKNYGGTGFEYGMGLGIDLIGNLFLTGYFDSGILSFDTVNLNQSGFEDIFLTKIDNLGNVIWARKAGGTDRDKVFGLSVDLCEQR